MGPVLETYQFSSVQSLSRVRLQSYGLQHSRPPCPSPTPRVYSNSMSIELVMPSNHLILFRPLLLPPSIFPSIRIYSDESVLRIRWPKYWRFSFSISPSKEYSGLISFRLDWLDLFAVKGLLRVFSNSTESEQVCGNGSLPSPLPPPPRAWVHEVLWGLGGPKEEWWLGAWISNLLMGLLWWVQWLFLWRLKKTWSLPHSTHTHELF